MWGLQSKESSEPAGDHPRSSTKQSFGMAGVKKTPGRHLNVFDKKLHKEINSLQIQKIKYEHFNIHILILRILSTYFNKCEHDLDIFLFQNMKYLHLNL